MAKRKISVSGRIGRAIDRAIYPFAPARAVKRAVARSTYDRINAMTGQYRGARTDRTNEKWAATGGSADQDLLDDLPKLRDRCRDLIRNNPFAASIAHTFDTNVVGHGLKPQSRLDTERLGITPDKADYIQKKIEEVWNRWFEHADAGERLDFYQIQWLVSRQRFENGDVFLLPVSKPKTRGRRYGLAFQIVEADRVDTPTSKYRDRNFRRGVEIGSYGEPVAYHVSEGFPGDWQYNTYQKNATFRRIPAFDKFGRKNVMHIYKMLRPDQSRGIPDLAPAIDCFYNLDKYIEAEIKSARMAACLSLFIKTLPEALNSGNGLAGPGAETTDDRGQIIDEIEPAMVKYLFPGEDVVTWNPARPGQTFDAFVQVILRMIAAGLNLPYELVAKDYTKSNYSNMRASLVQAYKGFRQLQGFMIANLCRPAWNMLIEEAFLLGDLDIPHFYEMREHWTRAEWLTDGWEWIDPQKEEKANEIALNNSTTTLTKIYGARGEDMETSIDRRGRELAMIKKTEEKYGVKFPEGGSKTSTVKEKDEDEEEGDEQ